MRSAPTVLLILPVYNEKKILRKSVETLLSHFKNQFPYELNIVIADNASSDGTDMIGKELADHYDTVSYKRIEIKGRGNALYDAWDESQADILSYMDIDLSTRIEYYLPLIRSVIEGNDIAIGVRLDKKSKVIRCLKREILSRGYALLFNLILGLKVNDAQCGFKAIRRESFQKIKRKIKDRIWFFDTELLYRAQQSGMKIGEVPVAWVEDQDSKVDITWIIFNYLISLICLRGNYGKFKN